MEKKNIWLEPLQEEDREQFILDNQEAFLYGATHEPQKRDGPKEWGDGLVWSELHHSAPWRIDWD